MFGLFSAKIDHPLADDAGVKRMLEMLPLQKPEAAVEETTTWLESLSGLDNFPPGLRHQRVVEFDAATIAQARRLARDYFSGPRGTRFEEQKRWQRIQGYWAHLAIAYARCLSDIDSGAKGTNALKADIGLLYARLLHALAGRLRWTRLRYGSVDGKHWEELGNVYQRSVGEKLASRTVSLYGQNDVPTTPATEYLKVLLFHASSIDNLSLLEIGITERLLAHFLPHFVFGETATPECTYWIDTAQAQPPSRLVKPPPPVTTVRFFGAGEVLKEITALRSRIQASKSVPPEINLGGQYPAEIVLPVLEHLGICWAPVPPTRKHARHRVEAHVGIVAGLQSIQWCVNGGGDMLSEIENWVVDDISQGGMSAHLPLLRNDWARVGALVGMRPDGNQAWLVGAIRRFVRESESQGVAGIQTLSKVPRALIASDGTMQTDIILLDPLQPDGSARVVMASANWEPGVPLQIELDGQDWRLHPEERLEIEDDWMMGRCVVETR